ncbi:hypothetical protein ACE34V_002038 [Vibrio alginolyticus]|uniref:hypothetical protein n=1 Tax=Vibrio antiquarius (strain Ex25) TaxID=150340 RepID=UPI000941C919|nr:hypothetical protein [Vibrio antiquarius]OKQ15914.1 hypothetical protein H058_20405 [Vibrio antiquarius]
MIDFNKYGQLITVIALLFVITYSGSGYDAWDIVLACFTGYFGVCFLYTRENTDWYSSFAASFLSVASASNILIALNSLYFKNSYLFAYEDCMYFQVSWHLLSIVVISFFLSLFLPRGPKV